MSHIKDIFMAKFSDFRKSISLERRKKKQFLLLLVASFLILAAIIGVAAGVTSRKNRNSDNSTGHAVLKSSCSMTLYPELCYSAVATVPGATDKLLTHKDVIQVSLNITTEAVQQNYFTIEKLINNSTKKRLTEREKTALHDCLEMVDETLDELHKTSDDLKGYDASSNKKNKSISQYANELKTLLSAAMTNQQSCLDGFSHNGASKQVRNVLEADQTHVFKMCSNALAMIKNMTDADMATADAKKEQLQQKYKLKSAGRHLLAEENADGREERKESIAFPEWLSAKDRRLLQASEVIPDVTVALDGSGNYSSVTEAVEAAPEKSSKRYIIKIKSGVYKENVEVKKKKTNLMFVGDGRKTTIITGSRNVVDGSTTFHSATVAAVGMGFLARDITFENTAGPSKHQAVALRVGSDQSAFHRCDILAYQDSLYVHSLRQFYEDCLVIGTVDFIFGNAAAVFQNCDIHARLPDSGQKNMVTAQGRADPNQNTGIVIQKCRIGATSELEPVKTDFHTYLGRPWKQYSRTIIMQSNIGDVIDPAGWHIWNEDFALDTLFYGEYQNAGAGSGTSLRVNWTGYNIITDVAKVQPFTVSSFIAGDTWLASTGFPFSLGLE